MDHELRLENLSDLLVILEEIHEDEKRLDEFDQNEHDALQCQYEDRIVDDRV